MSQQRRASTLGKDRPEPGPLEVAEPVTSPAAPKTDAAGESTKAASPTAKGKDLLYVHTPCESGDGFQVLRQRGERIEVGEIRTMREGQPIHGELVRLTPRKESERLFDVDVLLDAPKPQPRNGPARVATDRYRRNWETIFGARAAKRADDDSAN
jgi:hypothetical protein